MASIPEAIGVMVVIGVIPTLLGVIPSATLRHRLADNRWILLSFSSGLILALFVDLLLDASLLGLNLNPLTSSPTQLTLVGSFVTGMLLLASLGSKFKTAMGELGHAAVFIAGLGVAFHSLSEGLVIGFDIVTAGISLEFSSLVQGTSFSLHKFGEGFALSALYLASARLVNLPIAGLLASSPGIMGVALALLDAPGVVSSIFFAMGAGAYAYMLLYYLALSLKAKAGAVSYTLFILGYLFIFSTGVIHSIPFS